MSENTNFLFSDKVYCGLYNWKYRAKKERNKKVYLNARMYDPKIARFLQEDTYTGDPNDPLSLNLYTYSHNNPIAYYDPTGHAINLVAGLIGAGAGFLIGAGSSMIMDAFKGEFSGSRWKSYLGAGVQGAVVGGTAGVTMGGSLVVMAATGAAAGAVGNVANQTIRNGGFKNFNAKELAVSTIASGVGAGVAGATSGAATGLTSQITSQTLQKTAQGAAIGAASGASGGLAGNVTDQVWDIAAGEKKSFDVGSMLTDTLVGGTLGAGIGGAFGYAGSKYGSKISELDIKLKQSASKFVESSKSYFNKVLTDQTGSIKIGPGGSNKLISKVSSNTKVSNNTTSTSNSIRENVLKNIAENREAMGKSNFRNGSSGAGVGNEGGSNCGKVAYNGNIYDGSGFGKLADKEISVSQKGIEIIEQHLSGEYADITNDAMIARLKSAFANGDKITGADASFYMHEISETTMMNNGMSYAEAHALALQKYDVSPFSVVQS